MKGLYLAVDNTSEEAMTHDPNAKPVSITPNLQDYPPAMQDDMRAMRVFLKTSDEIESFLGSGNATAFAIAANLRQAQANTALAKGDPVSAQFYQKAANDFLKLIPGQKTSTHTL
jgi:hypothetical protein